jgi:hypothetical protein
MFTLYDTGLGTILDEIPGIFAPAPNHTRNPNPNLDAWIEDLTQRRQDAKTQGQETKLMLNSALAYWRTGQTWTRFPLRLWVLAALR